VRGRCGHDPSGMSTTRVAGVHARAWLERYRRAWEEADVEGFVELFTEDAIYHSHPFREPHLGHDGIRAYVGGATGTQERVEVRFGEPIVEGIRAAAEWWATMEDAEDGEVTLPGCLILRFAADGRCEELREYWHLEQGRREPHSGWGR
jgi:ketosteroid isomerase-like protein